ncbi:MAG: hypothetical protein ACTHUU_16955 [Brachybacterium sp.]
MSETTATDAATDDQPTIYTAYKIDFMLALRPTQNGAITREQVGLRRSPEAVRQLWSDGASPAPAAPTA